MAEEYRTDEKLTIAADVPGLRADQDIEISVTSGILRIRAGRVDRPVPETDLREGVFSRDIRLPSGTDSAGVRARYDDGILQVEVPMRSTGGPTRRVPVATGGRSGQEEGWYADPYGRHERRWFSEGAPTQVVSDGGVTSNDPPPFLPCPTPIVTVPDSGGALPDRPDLPGLAADDPGVTAGWEAFVEAGGD